MLFKVLVLAMLSTASGWGLPNDPLLESNEESTSITVEVDGARDRRQARSNVFSPNNMLPGYTGEVCMCSLSCDSGCDDQWWITWYKKCDDDCDVCYRSSGCNRDACEDRCSRTATTAAGPGPGPGPPVMPRDFSIATAVVTGAATKGEAGGEAPNRGARVATSVATNGARG